MTTRVSASMLGFTPSGSDDKTALQAEVDALSVKTGGTAYGLMTSTDYGYIRLFRNNSAASAITTKLSGCDILPVNRVWGADGVERGHFGAQRTVLSTDTTPTGGTWVVGDRIEHLTFAAGKNGTVCTVAGSPGTWVLY